MPDVMLKERSPLADVSEFATSGVAIVEQGGFSLTQVAGFSKTFEKDLAAAVGKLPGKVGVALGNDTCTVLRVGPQQFWLIGMVPKLPASCLATPLSSARCRIKVEGEKAGIVLSRAAPLDFSATAFKPNTFAMTGIHHTPVLIHCIAADTFHVYALRTFSLAVCEWLVDSAQGLEN